MSSSLKLSPPAFVEPPNGLTYVATSEAHFTPPAFCVRAHRMPSTYPSAGQVFCRAFSLPVRQTPINLSACVLRKNQPGADGHDRRRDLFSDAEKKPHAREEQTEQGAFILFIEPDDDSA
jgi:hypothetical protein